MAEPKKVNVAFKVSEDEHALWKETAKLLNISIVQLIRRETNRKVHEVIHNDLEGVEQPEGIEGL